MLSFKEFLAEEDYIIGKHNLKDTIDFIRQTHQIILDSNLVKTLNAKIRAYGFHSISLFNKKITPTESIKKLYSEVFNRRNSISITNNWRSSLYEYPAGNSFLLKGDLLFWKDLDLYSSVSHVGHRLIPPDFIFGKNRVMLREFLEKHRNGIDEMQLEVARWIYNFVLRRNKTILTKHEKKILLAFFVTTNLSFFDKVSTTQIDNVLKENIPDVDEEIFNLISILYESAEMYYDNYKKRKELFKSYDKKIANIFENLIKIIFEKRNMLFNIEYTFLRKMQHDILKSINFDVYLATLFVEYNNAQLKEDFFEYTPSERYFQSLNEGIMKNVEPIAFLYNVEVSTKKMLDLIEQHSIGYVYKPELQETLKQLAIKQTPELKSFFMGFKPIIFFPKFNDKRLEKMAQKYIFKKFVKPHITPPYIE